MENWKNSMGFEKSRRSYALSRIISRLNASFETQTSGHIRALNRNDQAFKWLKFNTVFRNLSSYALQSRQNPGLNVSPQYYRYTHPNRLLGSYKPYPAYAKPYPYKPIAPNQYYQRPPHLFPTHNYPSYPESPYSPNQFPERESVMKILHSVASNDDLQCVPKIICEVTSGTMGGRQTPIGLPLNLNLESLTG